MVVPSADVTAGTLNVHPCFFPVTLIDFTLPHKACVAASGAYTFTLIWVSRWLKANDCIGASFFPSFNGVAIISVLPSIVPKSATPVACIKDTPVRRGYQPISLVLFPFAR